jgi:hypothetical protein
MATKRLSTEKIAKKTAGVKRAAKQLLDFPAFLPQTIATREHSFHLGCVLDVFTSHIVDRRGLIARAKT